MIASMIEKFDRYIEIIAQTLIGVCLFLMLTLTLLNIVSRWFNETFMWIDPLVRHLVFLSAFMGGVLATGNASHIKIDLLGRALEAKNLKKFKKYLRSALFALSALACFLLAKSGLDFAKVEFEYGSASFLNIHSGHLVSIIPFGFFLIGLRFIAQIFLNEEKGE